MRRMYSEKELTTIINQVVGEYIEAGALDESIADAVDAYLVEHPVDITALEGQTIAPAIVNAETSISAPSITGDSIIENMSGYSMALNPITNLTEEVVFGGVVKNGNKLTIVFAINLTKTDTLAGSQFLLQANIPSAVGSKLYQTTIGGYSALGLFNASAVHGSSTIISLKVLVEKPDDTKIKFYLQSDTINSLPLNEKTYLRIEQTYLLSDNLLE